MHINECIKHPAWSRYTCVFEVIITVASSVDNCIQRSVAICSKKCLSVAKKTAAKRTGRETNYCFECLIFFGLTVLYDRNLAVSDDTRNFIP